MSGLLRFYKAYGKVAFLTSGAIVRPILPKSQCWCVDDATKFVLPVSQNQFYRIELPNKSEADEEKAEELKKVLATILQYETTPCPFQRSFTVQLPEPPTTPVRRRPWRPTVRMKNVEDATPSEPVQESTDEYVTADSDNNSASGGDDDIKSLSGNHDGMTRQTTAANGHDSADIYKSSVRPNSLTTGRAITAPMQATSKGTLPAIFGLPTSGTSLSPNEPPNSSSSIDSFRSFHSPISPLPPSPPYSNPPSPLLAVPRDIDLPRRRPHMRDISDITITSDSPNFWDAAQTPTRPTHGRRPARSPESPSPALDTDSQSDDIWSDVMEIPASTDLRRRQRHSYRRTHSPLPLPANLYTPTSRSSGHHITTAVLQKTCSILLGPPVQLIALMLNIAKRIASGATKGVVFGYGAAGERIPCQWDYSDEDELGAQDWDEDDYGIALGNLPPNERERVPMSGSWEVD